MSQLCAKAARFKKITTVKTHSFLPVGVPATAFTLVPGTGYIIPNGVLPAAPVVGTYDFWEQAYSVSVQEFSEDVFTSGQLVLPEYLNCSLINNNIYTTSNIHNVYIARITYQMIKKYICFTQSLTQTTAGQVNVNFSSLKFPTEHFAFGLKFIPTSQDDVWSMEDWHKFTYTEREDAVWQDWQYLNRYQQLFHKGDMTGFDSITGAKAGAVGAPETEWMVPADYVPAGKDACDIHQFADESQYITSTLLRAQQIDIIKPQIQKFFNGYVPWQKKGLVLGTEDKGI